MDLQLAYLAAPASAAAANVVQQAPATAQEASQAAFAAQLQQREETIEESPRTEGAKIRGDAEGGGNADGYTPRKRQARTYRATTDDVVMQLAEPDESHLIDTTA